MSIKFTNNAATSLASGITNVATSLTVASGKGALFPTLSGGDVFYATLANSSGVVEIVQVTARTTDTFTIVRGQDGTTAVAWNTGDKVELRPTAVSMTAMAQKANNLSDLASVATARTNLGATTVGSNLMTLANPSAVTFPRVNADNTVSTLDAATFRTAIGAGTSSTTGTVTSVTAGGGLTGGTITSSGTIAIDTTTYAIGQIITGRPANYTNYAVGNTVAGSSLYTVSPNAGYVSGAWQWYAGYGGAPGTASLVNTGTWKCIAPTQSANVACVQHASLGLWVRIS